jgi:alkyl sulfatase BDS1-like metallo-beta-lactamase superfamily hydrolase
MNHLVFAQPRLREARELGAAALEQMGYQAESATWRNAFLLGARELREGHRAATQFASRSRDMVCAITEDMFFDYLAVRIDGLKAQNLNARFDWRFTDAGKRFSVNLQHGALTWSALPGALPPHAQIDMTRETLNQILCGETGFASALREGHIRVTGDADAFKSLLGALEQVDNEFNVVEP